MSADTILIAEIRAQHCRRRAKWTRARVHRLCSIMGITIPMLAAYLDWTASALRAAMNNNKFTGPTCIALEIYERDAFAAFLGEHRKLNLPFPANVT